MRFAAPAAVLAAMLALSASAGMSQTATSAPNPQALALQAEGHAALAAGDTQGAVDAFEAALVIDPALSALYLDLAAAARAEGLQGKAIHYYREARARDPQNLAALTGEGEALVEKGALSAARETLAELQTLCGADCTQTRQLAAAIDRGTPVLTAEAVSADQRVTQN